MLDFAAQSVLLYLENRLNQLTSVHVFIISLKTYKSLGILPGHFLFGFTVKILLEFLISA
jgi:hypothetical protein